MLTAEEYALENMQGVDLQEIESALIGFAQMHIKAALKAAAEKGLIRIQNKEENYTEKVLTTYAGSIVTVDKNSILNAYPLENIK